ncbi:MAG: 50S ribosomal protein L13 [Candidatus Nealsonbacteria bacterium RIFCSPLOWO2_01_FULL_41_9]|uniref:Large ribosomal subunit protein uL13 n=1 Tax=Candidatus Nealsonbacteria bacterium RIFCSPLOWO2_01_FULL_41_9 TaxID=1801671 RepID=A0A1G2EDQ1_9BACT|nr:MAG: 50S ribosomal protein L13 [Candidatus Nealsonbacteria bacterium RIFCSPLOWO2_01_FULL_41_9]
MQRETHTIDATDKVLGRLASQIAILLRGKHKPDFVPYSDMGDNVVIKNIQKIKFTGKKLEQKTYFRHSAYMGNKTITPLKEVFTSRPALVLKRAVLGMLPKNKLRAKMIRRLKVEK